MQDPSHSFSFPRLLRFACIALVGAVVLSAWAQAPNNLERDTQEQRRAQERENVLREQQERTPDVRLPSGPATAFARLPQDEKPCFTIQHIALKGDTFNASFWLLPALSGPDAQDSPIGRCLGTKSIGILQQRGQDALVAKGFVTSRLLPEPQDLSSGTLTLTLIPGRIGAIRFKDPGTASTSLKGALPAESDDILNLRDIEQALENFKRVPTADADIQMVPADQPDQSDLVVAYQQTQRIRLSMALDDSGSKSSGLYQGGVTVSLDNPLGLNDLFYITLNHDAGGGDSGDRGTQGNAVHYSLPYGYWTLGSTFSQSRYHQTVVGLSQNYVYSGTSANAEIKLARLVYRDAARKTTLSLKAFARHSNNFVDDTEVMVQRRAVGGWELGAADKVLLGAATLETNLAYKRGTPDFDSIPAPEEASNEGTSRFGLWTADASLTWPFKVASQNLRYSGTLRVQDNITTLTPQDRFSIGGRYTVRGFDGESSLSAERGVLLRNDMDLALGDSGQEIYLGVDWGEVGGSSSASLAGQNLSGAVVGLRGVFKKLQYDLFVGAPLYKPEGFKTADTTAGFSLNLSF
jgi:hemolysin activation/secretion protein